LESIISDGIDCLINEIDICCFDQVPKTIIDGYKTTPQNRRRSASYDEPTTYTASSFKGLASLGVVPLNSFRRGMVVGTKDEINMHIWNIAEDNIQAIVIEQLFKGDENNFFSFLDEQVIILEKLRTFWWNYRNSLPKNRIKKIDETSQLQPVFFHFLKGLIRKLNLEVHDDFDVKNINDSPTLERKINVMNEKNEAIELSLSGYSDLAIQRSSESFLSAENFHSIIELKSPFKSLWKSASESEKDQLVGEVTAVNSMKLEAEFEVDRKTLLLGGLTDMFSINIMVQLMTSKECFMSPSVVESRSYLVHLLMLLLSFDDESITPLIADSRKTKVPVPNDDSADYEEVLQRAFEELNLTTPPAINTRSLTKKNDNKNNSKSNSKKRSKLLNRTQEDYDEKLEILHYITKNRSPLSDITESKLNQLSSMK
jgi:hypothetical protein